MIAIQSNLIRITPHEPKMVEYPNRVKKLYVKGNSKKLVPPQNLFIKTRTFVLNKLIDNQFTEF